MKRFPAELEYRRNPKLSKDAVLRILDWVQGQPHLPDIEEEDAILFLVSCDFDEEYAQTTIDKYYTFRTSHPELFSGRDPLDETSNFTNICGYFATLPGLSRDGCKVIYTKMLKNADMSKFSHLTEAKFLLCMHEVMLLEEGAVQGWRVIFDMEDMKYSMLLKLRPTIIKNLNYYCKEASPIRMLGLHIINPKSYVAYFTNILKFFSKTSTADFTQVHSNLEELYEYVQRQNLPLGCGGDLPPVEETAVAFKQKIIGSRNILIRKERLQVQEILRPTTGL